MIDTWLIASFTIPSALMVWPPTTEFAPLPLIVLRKPTIALPRLLVATDGMPRETLCWRVTLGPIWKVVPPPVM